MTSLREALAARPDDDFVIAAPVRRKSPVRSKKKKVGIGARMLSLALRHPRQVLTTVLLAGCGGTIAWNALVLQTAHHPAPLFNQREAAPVQPAAQPLPPMRPADPLFDAHAQAPASSSSPIQTSPANVPPPVATAPAAAPKLPSRGAIADLIRNGGEAPQPPARAAPGPAVVTTPTKPSAVRDPIGDIIRMGGPVPTPPANVGRAEAGDLVLNGQRALAKLGYGIKVDGIMGAGTRQAIERFEKDRNLPVTGEFGGRTARELSAASGIAVH